MIRLTKLTVLVAFLLPFCIEYIVYLSDRAGELQTCRGNYKRRNIYRRSKYITFVEINKTQSPGKGLINPCPAEPGYTLPLQTVQIQISWLLRKPNDRDLHCLSLSVWIYIYNLDQVIWLDDSYKLPWYLNLSVWQLVRLQIANENRKDNEPLMCYIWREKTHIYASAPSNQPALFA